MLSIIVSSYQEDFFKKFEQSVISTIGDNFIYEIIKILNPNIMGICEAYNLGASKSKFDNLLFIHEDVSFNTLSWGNILIEYLKNPDVGCIGIAGSNIKTLLPIPWWSLDSNSFSNINQYFKNDKIVKFRESKINEVILLDGVFISCRKKIWQEIKFNQNILKGFHGYDIDYSLRTSSKYKNYVINNILIEHYSEGSLSKKWFVDLLKIYFLNFYVKSTCSKTVKYDRIKALKFFAYYCNYLR